MMRLIAGYAISVSIYVMLIPYVIWHNTQHKRPSRIFPRVAASLMLSAGFILYVWSHIALAAVHGGAIDFFGVNISPRTKKLNTTGPYALIRNPMAIGAYLGYAGLALWRGSGKWLAILAGSVPFSLGYFKAVEEKRLLSDFGREYLKYRKVTSLFIPLQFKKKHRTCRD